MNEETQASRSGSKFAKVIEIQECRYGPMLAFAEDTVITRSLQTYGEWSEHEIDILSRYIRDETVVLDVGANIGTHSLAFAKRKPRALIWGFEPQPLVNSLAWTNCARNGAQNVAILPMACGSEPSDIVLGPPLAADMNVGGFSLVPLMTAHYTQESGNPISGGLRYRLTRLFRRQKTAEFPIVQSPEPPLTLVRVAPLDSLRLPLPVSLIKIDVEGMEPAVLSGARQLLARDRPVVFFEILSTDGFVVPRALLGGLSYRLFWMETHQFNRTNFQKTKSNLWWRTEMGVLALPPGKFAHQGIYPIDEFTSTLTYRQDARKGCSISYRNTNSFVEF